MVNRSVCPIMKGQHRFILKRNSSQVSGVEEISIAMSILRLSITHCSQMMICGMTKALLKQRSHRRVKVQNMYLLLHLYRQSKHLRHPHHLRENRTIPPVTQSTDKRALHLPINFLHRHHKFLPPEKKHHPRKATIICLTPP